MKYIEELISYDNSIDAIQISEILWLSQFMGSSSEPIETSTPPLDNSKPLDGVDNDRDNNIEDEIDTKEEKQEEQDYPTPNTPQKERGDYGFDKKDDIRSVFSTNVTKKEKLPAIDKQFSSLKVKQKTISSDILDDSKTADYIATTGYFHPIFKEEKSKKSYFNLHIIIDQSESIFLWEKYVEHFIKSVKFSTNFKSIKIFNLESNQDNVTVSYANSNHKIKTNSALFKDSQSITLVFSDITGKAWKSNMMFKILEKWSKGSFVAIVSMLPKRMWKKTPLRQGINIFTKSTKFLPKNRDLKAELNIINKEDNKINIPLLTFDSNAFSYLSDVLMHKKDSWIDTRIFKNLTLQEVNNKKTITISPKERVKKFFSFALPKVRQLAIYCSVLPLNQEIIREVIRVKELGNEKDVFSEFYFGGLIDKDIVATFGEYAFYEGVAKELRQYISVQEMEILLHQVSEVMSSSFGIDTTKINLLYESVDGSEELNDNERALVALMIEVLEDKGRFYEEETVSLKKLISKKDSNSNQKTDIKTSIVQIETSRGNGIGALINYNNEDGYTTVITTRHLLYNDIGELLKATINDGNTFYDIDLNKVDSVESVDLAIFKIEHKSYHSLLNVENEKSKVGTMVSILTYNNGREYIYNGKITTYLHKSTDSYQIILDINQLSQMPLSGSPIIDTVTNRLIGIVSMLDMQNNVIEAISITKLFQPILKLDKDYIIGREKELKQIDELLNENSILLIYGVAGIGKTTIANHYLYTQKNKFDYHKFFKGLESFIFELREPLALQQEKEEDAFMEALSKLKELKGNKLLVFDDVRDIEENREKIEKILTLKNYGYKILLTSREEIENINQYYLDTLSLEDAKKLFNSIYKVEDEQVLEEILRYLDCHALFVEMTAKTLKNKKSLTAKEIKEKFEKGEFSTISVKRKQSFNKFLNELFSFDNLDNEEILLLKQFSALPSIEIDFNFLETLFQKKEDSKFEELLDYFYENGWLVKIENGYKLHQIIKEYILSNYTPSFKEIKLILDTLTTLMGNTYDIQVAVNNKENIVYFESLVKILEMLEEENEKVGTFFNSVGHIYHHLGAYKKAELLYKKALKIFKRILGEKHPNTATSYNNLAELYRSMGEYQKTEPLYLNLKALKIREEMLGEEHPDTAMSYNNLAELYRSMGEYQKAEPLYLKALKILEKVLGENHHDIAINYNGLANLYYSQGEYSKAKEFIKKCIRVVEQLDYPYIEDLKTVLSEIEINLKK